MLVSPPSAGLPQAQKPLLAALVILTLVELFSPQAFV